MIFIAVKFTIRPERSARWLEDVAEFTRATREEPGNLFYEWSKSVDNEHEYVLLEAFADAEAGEVHVKSEHFRTAMAWMPDAVAETPKIINVEVPGSGWSAMAEVQPRQ
ncbi:antibiotic biosynthesis monooxygenase [Streptosporangium nondiastaticum]|uniref:Antibiotic biosynthesis monooxygenase n=2 Tax=Actinomycetes TaxID=1760 RepID=A0A9X7JVM9_9ACTN|nr:MULTISPECIES: putative quinol monooxygenase [Actinomycetes]PSJ30692.1 antibiotic biosynthesis monooxygenase [Streptosporangium nondiastaticum]WKU42725.1 putative quinol monooxygenase [Streptomyces sp. VNUA116]